MTPGRLARFRGSLAGRMLRRRQFVHVFGWGSTAVLMLGVAACGDGSGENPAAGQTEETAPTTPPTTPTTISGGSDAGYGAYDTASAATWSRVNLGFVSAYLVVRSGETAVIDTGVEGSAPAIEQALGLAGSRWADVSHVLATHSHPDHVGSLPAVLASATAATAYAGAADIPAITSPRPVLPLSDGQRIFGLEVIATPGHTPGHVSFLDPELDVLFAGDAMNGTGGGLTGANPRYSADMALADESVKKLAARSFDDIVFGHGEPVLGGASDQVIAYADGL